MIENRKQTAESGFCRLPSVFCFLILFMYLEKLQIQGFKSFAQKNVLVFPGMMGKTKRGITAVVGPNGSGKSNIADAVRWALGEQSMKILRSKKGEDVIFSGSDKKGRLGMAEVSLHLNNSEHKAPIDYSEVILTRRLFRDGDSEYLLNNSRVRLSDVQMLLAKAKFGQKTYSVIGQGMVEGFLNTSLAERKEFFDEATGVKQFQIKRDDSLNKLRASYENLEQVSLLLSEIEPRLRSLIRQVGRLEKREVIEKELKELQLKYYSRIWHEMEEKFNQANHKFLELESVKREKEKKLEQFNRELGKLEEGAKKGREYGDWQESLAQLQGQKEEVVKKIARLEAQIEVSLESQGRFDLSWLAGKKEELEREIKIIGGEIEILEKNIKHDSGRSSEQAGEQNRLDRELKKLNDSLLGLNLENGQEEKSRIKEVLEKILNKLKSAEEENDVSRLKSLLANFRREIKDVISQIKDRDKKEEAGSIQERIAALTEEKAALITKINENNLRVSARSERAKLLKEKLGQLKSELDGINLKLKEEPGSFGREGAGKQKNELEKELAKIEEKIKDIKNKIERLNTEEEEVRNNLFAWQKNIQNLQNEINDTSGQLGELKVNSARHETRLEDLEAEIRQNFGSLKEIKDYKAELEFDLETGQEKMGALKRQLELIGGIDPEIVKEHKETKERYDFLSGQVSDLRKAIGSLEGIIRELDVTIKERFDKEFKIIHQKFEEYFKILFNGGTAKIIKVVEPEEETAVPSARSEQTETEDEESGEVVKDKVSKPEISLKNIKFLKKHNATGLAGIEIQATPPGKKIKSISMLSGGERALTAIALICAIISANPSPFVVLDEVDAALDESNSERLAKILDDLSHRTQFIIITHNRASMRRANVLYGVTMGDDGISKLLSVKLEEVKVD